MMHGKFKISPVDSQKLRAENINGFGLFKKKFTFISTPKKTS